MYCNNKGSILIYILIVFSIVSTITMMCIGLNYSNIKISSLNYQNLVIKESLLSSIEIVHSNILKEVAMNIENSDTEEEFKKYFQEDEFLNNIKSISNSQINNVSINIPTKINCDSNGLITFKIESIFSDDNYLRIYSANVKIDTNLNNYNSIESSEEHKTYDNIEKTIINPSDLVIVYDYKGI